MASVRGVLRASVQYLSKGLSSLGTENGAVRSCPHRIMKTCNPFSTVTRSFCLGARFHSVRVQQPAPDFKGTAVVDGQFKNIQLSDFKGQYLVLFFYPLDFTFVCPTELVAFNDSMNQFKALNTAVVGVSTDSHFSHLAWIRTPRKEGGLGGCLNYPLLADFNKTISRDYDAVLIIAELFQEGGLGGCLNYPLLADFNKTISRDYDVLIDSAGFALRGLFIIDTKGIVRQMTINDLPVGRSVEEILRLVKAFQYTDQHGEVCPANWNPETNPDTIKPSPEASLDYFKKVK